MGRRTNGANTMNQLTELFIRMKQMENAIDLILMSLPASDNDALNLKKIQATRRQERLQAEQVATQEYLSIKSRLQELENDYPTLKKL
jgi:enoyl-[acyl-carrier-protein] reductase (NADH)